MLKSSSDPGLVSLSIAFYRLLVTLYPARFKTEYGEHMVQVFRDCGLKAFRQSGTPALLSLWALTLFDLVKTLVEEHLERGTQMSHMKFIRLSGWALALAGLALMLGVLASNYQSLALRTFGWRYSTTETIGVMLFVAVALLLVLGMLGLYLRGQGQIGISAKISLIGGMVFGVVNVLGIWPLVTTESEQAWTAWFFSFVLIFLSLGIYGATALRISSLRRWNALPLLAGLPLPIGVLIIFILEQFYGAWQVNLDNWFMFILLLITTVSLGLLGYRVQADPPGDPAMV